jgi:hypothetical protein
MGELRSITRTAEARSLIRAITSAALSTMSTRGVSSEKLCRQNWPRDDAAMQILKGAVGPLMTTGSFVVHDPVGMFRSLAPGSAALKLFDVAVKVSLAGVNTVKIPLTSGVPNKPIFIAEGAPAPVVKLALAATTVGPAKKIVVLAAVSQELEDSSPDNATTVIGTILANAANAAIDYTAFGTAAATSAAPAGLLNGVTPATASSNSDMYMALSEDLANLAAAVGTAGIDPSDLIYVAGPREATIIKVRAAELADNVLMTLGLPAKSVAAFAPSAVFTGFEDGPTVETRKETSIHVEDTNPAELVSSPGVVAAPQTSIWQTNKIAIRVRATCAWAAAPGAAQIVNSVTW